MSDKRILPTRKAVADYVRRELGFKVAEKTIYNACADGRIPTMKRKPNVGKFDAAAVTRAARVNFGDKAPLSTAADAPGPAAAPAVDPALATAQEQRVLAEAKLKRATAERALLGLARDQGRLVPRDCYERDLAARMAFFSSQLDALFAACAAEIVTMLGADAAVAQQIIELVHGDPAHVQELVGWVQKSEPEVVDRLMRKKQTLLLTYARERVQEVELEDYLARAEQPEPGEAAGV